MKLRSRTECQKQTNAIYFAFLLGRRILRLKEAKRDGDFNLSSDSRDKRKVERKSLAGYATAIEIASQGTPDVSTGG